MHEGHKDKILIVDDNPETLMMLVNVLNEEYSVIAATSGKKALEIAQNGDKPDMILLDVLMEGMDGFEVCRILKSDPQTSYIPLMFLTALEEERDILQGFDLGAVDYVTKPFEPKVLKARVKTHLQLKHFNDDLCRRLQEKEEMLLQQSKMAALGEMFENITHQWKQPLSIISLRCASLRMEYDLGEFKPEAMVETLDVIENSIQHMSQTINDFKNFIRSADQKEHFDLSHLIDSTTLFLNSKLHNREITITKAADPITLYTYKNDLVQVFMNLFNNAIDALENSPSERFIRISAHVEGQHVIIDICDNAGGIEEAILPVVFDKYVTTKGSHEGSGLGLYMSRQIIRNRPQGEIEAFNTAEGACFRITLPHTES
jgi:signal transduction histidine kinase